MDCYRQNYKFSPHNFLKVFAYKLMKVGAIRTQIASFYLQAGFNLIQLVIKCTFYQTLSKLKKEPQNFFNTNLSVQSEMI
jgi:hypothetical protein